MVFKPPKEEERLRAIGSLEKLPDLLKRTFKPGKDFNPIPAPGSGDWLYVHPEPGQTYSDFIDDSWNKPDSKRNKIYLLPIGNFPKEKSPSLESLKEFSEAFFSMRVDILPARSIRSVNFTTRINPLTKNRQILTTNVLDFLEKNLPEDAFCLLAITMEDLYPEPSWNFVFGQASLSERVGIFSFARYDPAFYGMKRTQDYMKVLLKRSSKVLAHETSHMFGLHHCVYFKCIINGSNHLEESDSRPIHLCPVCLRKLHYSIGFDVIDRYESLFRFYKKYGFENEAVWIKKRLKEIKGNP